MKLSLSRAISGRQRLFFSLGRVCGFRGEKSPIQGVIPPVQAGTDTLGFCTTLPAHCGRGGIESKRFLQASRLLPKPPVDPSLPRVMPTFLRPLTHDSQPCS